MQVVIVQHAEKAREPGDPGLTANGRAQASSAARWLARERWDLLIASPMQRSIETAQAVCAATGLEAQVDPRVREPMNWQGNEPFEQFLADWERATRDRDWRPSQGDTSREAGARFAGLLDELAQDGQHRRVIIVSHGGVTMDLLRTLFGNRLPSCVPASALENGPASCGFTTLGYDSNGWQLAGFSDTQHLLDPPGTM